MLLQTRVLLTSVDGSNRFQSDTKDHSFYVDPDVLRDMGNPSQITITITPGDELNT